MEETHLILFVILCLGVHRSSLEPLQRQKRAWIIDSLEIDEGYKGTFPYSLGKIKIAEEIRLLTLKGQGVELDPKDVLKINQVTGEIFVLRPVDYEEYSILKLTFEAINKDNNIVDTRLGVEVKIKDANDNPPIFAKEMVEISIMESTEQGTTVITLAAHDKDAEGRNNQFDMSIVSVTPEPQDLEFYLEQQGEIGTISFKGCLDHEKAEKYTIIVEAKDRGEKIQLSSSNTVILNIEDGNNHHPEMLEKTISGMIKEGVENVLVSRVRVEDKDTRGTAAWRAKYQIHGDTNGNFRIETDPETNDGLLYVMKVLSHEEDSMVNVSVSVENEIPYHLCKVAKRTSTGLWQVVSGAAALEGSAETTIVTSERATVTVTVEDVNEAPVFDDANKQAKLAENIEKGYHLATFTARDPDIKSANKFVYVKGEDPAGWIAVDSATGKVTTVKPLDRESPHVRNGVYNVTILAVDDGIPQMTGTATLTIHVSDENDNAPTLSVNTISMCQSSAPSVANISVSDPDGDPYSGPFTFKLLGDVEGKWRVDPRQGHSLTLVKESAVYSGEHKVMLEVADRQHTISRHNLSVTVCKCHDVERPSCHQRKVSGSTGGGVAIGIILSGILLFAAALCAILLTCKREIFQTEIEEESYGHLIKSNTEACGTDCKVTLKKIIQEARPDGVASENISQYRASVQKETVNGVTSKKGVAGRENINLHQTSTWKKNSNMNFNNKSNLEGWLLGASSSMNTGLWGERSQELYQSWNGHRKCFAAQEQYDAYENGAHRQMLLRVLNMVLHRVQAAGDELDDYGPHVYAEEGVAEADYELDVIPLPDITFDQNMDLDYRFKDLASVSMTHKSFPVQKTFITNESSSTTETTVMMYESAIDAMESAPPSEER